MEARPMDIILTSGNGKFSKYIQWANRLKGYRGMAAKLSHGAEMSWANMVHESTTLNKWCGKSGVQKNDYYLWLANYDGDVWIRPYLDNPELLREQVLGYERDVAGTPYENGIPGLFELIKCQLGIGILPPTGNIFCIENIIKKRKWCDQISDDILDYTVNPADMWLNGKFDKLIMKHTGNRLWGVPIKIK